MENVLVKTEYSWYENIYFPAWEVWDKTRLEEAKKNIHEYFDTVNEGFSVNVGKDKDMYIERANDILGPWCLLTVTPLSDIDAETLNRLFNGSTGKVPLSKLYQALMRTWNTPD